MGVLGVRGGVGGGAHAGSCGGRGGVQTLAPAHAPAAALTLPPSHGPRPRLVLQAPRNCVVLPCLHFLYCDVCIKARCGGSAAPACPACSAGVTGFQTLLLQR